MSRNAGDAAQRRRAKRTTSGTSARERRRKRAERDAVRRGGKDVRAVLGRLPDGPEELAAAGGGVRVERGAVGKEAVEGRDELRGGDVGRAVVVERPDEEGGLVDGLRGRVERVKSGRTRRTRPTTVCAWSGGVDAATMRTTCAPPSSARERRRSSARVVRSAGSGIAGPGRAAETPAKARRRLTASSVTSRGLRARSGAMRAKPRVAHMSSWSAAEWRTQWKTKSSAPRRCRVSRPRGR